MSNLAFKEPSVEKQSISGPPALRESFVAWARFVAQKDQLKVVFGSNPATNGKVMYLPSLPYNLTTQDLLMVRSDIIHESGHCVDTDFEYFTQFGMTHGPLAQSLLNSIEDVRIEILRAVKYPGAEALIHDSNCLLMERNQCRTGSADAADALTTFCYMQGCVLRGWKGLHEQALRTAIDHLVTFLGEDSKPIIDQCIDLLVSGYPALGSTQDAGQLTLKVLSLFQDATNENAEEQDSEGGDGEQGENEEGGDQSQDDSKGESPEKGDQGEDDSSSSKGDSNSDDSGDDSGSKEGGKSDASEGENSDEAEGKAEQSESSKGESSESGKGAGEQPSDGAKAKAGQPGNDGKAKMSAAIAEMLNADPGDEEVIDHHKQVMQLAEDVSKGRIPHYKHCPVVTEHSADFSQEAKEAASALGVGNTAVVGGGWADKDKLQYRRLEAGVQAKANVLLGQLQMLLRMATKSDSQESTRGRLNTRKLYRTGFDDNRVFKTATDRVLPASAVSVLTDLSGSMVPRSEGNLKVRSRLDEALQVQILLLKAMAVIGNPMEMAGFGGHKKNALTFAKTFDEQPMAAQDRIGGMVHEAGGGTPLVEALTHASMRLMEREERRKVMFIITDGLPADVNQVVNMMNSCREDGIEVITFLIGSQPSERPSYLNQQKVVFVPTLDEFSAKALAVLKEHTLGS